jgi:hypothetical protein
VQNAYEADERIFQEAGDRQGRARSSLTHYNFVRFYRSIRCTPAMEAGVASSPLTLKDLVDMAA